MGSPATRDKIVEIGDDLLQRRGFNAFSYQDIADQLGIRKASVHYHFSNKSDLGTALAERNANWALQTLQHIDTLQLTPWQQFDAFLTPFLARIRTCERMSPGAMLASELETLPQTVQERNFEYYLIIHTWLTRVLSLGRNSGEMYFATDPAIKADAVISMLEGAAVLAKTRKTADFLDPLMADIKSGLGA
ncbi:TetR/AcrR family transcriptional regulator [Magnetovibrio sp. PR-2]|uniref:TetR/AcrR family transcriptional regulator n=1 Tax=Magnetovibrio sp. PR-2 TaxID=3120356 RepID=UPI002FCE3A80